MGDVIDMHEWLRTHRRGGASGPETDSERSDSISCDDAMGAALVARIHDLADSSGTSIDTLLEERLLRERCDGRGLDAAGALAHPLSFPPELDDGLREAAAVRDLTLVEFLQALLSQLRDPADPPRY
jgi:hypothetical protein